MRLRAAFDEIHISRDDFEEQIKYLVDNDYGQMYMSDEGRMVHIGNWQYRLDRWLRNKIQKR